MRKRLSLKSLEAKLDRVFSVYIRLRDSKDGFCQCVTCRAQHHWQDIDCGHFWKRQHKATRWEPMNCHPQCTACNRFKHGAEAEHATYILNTYGRQAFNELEEKHRQVVKFTRDDLERMISEFDGQVKELQGGSNGR